MTEEFTEGVLRVGSISGPYFAEIRHAMTGCGWVVGARDALRSDGKVAFHIHWTFDTEDRAKAAVAELVHKLGGITR